MGRVTRSQAKAQATSAPITVNLLPDVPEKKVFRPIPVRAPEDFYKLATFEAIPTSILKIIQQYSNKHDYRQLLNTNAAIFQHSKYETVYYNFIGYEKWKRKLKGFNDKAEQKDYFADLYASVKDKSTQISLNVDNPTQKIVKENGHFMPGIHRLTFSDRYTGAFWRNDTDMNVFCNIYHVCLRNVERIDRLRGLTGIKILEVHQSYTLLAIEFIPGLKRLVLSRLHELREIPQFGNIPELMISECWKLNLRGLGNHKRVKIDFTPHLKDLTMFQNVSCLSLTHIPEKLDLHLFINLTYLDINYSNRLDSIFDPLPFIKLRYLKLGFAKVMIGSGNFPTSLEIAEFNHCVFDHVSVVSHVAVLSFLNCRGEGFHNVSSLSTVHKLRLDGLQELEDVSALVAVYELSLISCRNVKDISKLGRVHRLRVCNCGVTSLEGLGQGNSEVYLSGLATVDFTPLKSVYKVSLDYCTALVDGKDVADVKHLSITRCCNFEDTSALGKVKSLYLMECHKISKLVGLEDVPHVHLERCNELEDIDCLGKQEVLIISYCRKLHELMKEDRKIGKYDEMFDGIPFVRIDPRVSIRRDYFRSSLFPEIFSEKILVEDTN